LMSFHDPDSDVSRLNREAYDHLVRVHEWTFDVLEASVELHRRSRGLFDIAVAPVLQSMGLLPPSGEDAPVQNAVYDAHELLEGHRVCFRPRHVKIDLGGIAKGFAVDQALNALRRSGSADCGLVNAGGDLAAFGAEPQAVAIRHPRDPSRVLG